MSQSGKQAEVSFKYILMTLIAVGLSWLIHEFAHWATGELLGNAMSMTLNTAYPRSGNYKAENDAMIVDAAGPIITLIQALVFYFILRKSGGNLLFPFLLVPLYMRTVAGIMNFINLNDEGRISRDLGIGPLTIPLLVFGILGYLAYTTSTFKGYNGKFIASSILLIMLLSSVLILVDQALKIILL
jgi:hypothetical protein